jgi:primosomal protein N' (replication factor Y)
MPTYLEIAVNVPRVSGVFHYHLPPGLEDSVAPGHLVEVPFGKQNVQGVVLRQISEPEVPDTKAVSALIDEGVVITPAQILLAEHLAEYTLAPLAACVAVMLPAGLSKQADIIYTLRNSEETELSFSELNQVQTRLVALLHKRGPLRGRQIEHAMARTIKWRPAMRALVKKELVSSAPVLPPPSIRPKYVRTAQLAAPPEVVEPQLDELGSTTATKTRRRKIMEFLIREPDQVDVDWVYAESGGKLADLQLLNERGLLLLREQESMRDPLAGLAYDPSEPPTLTPDQSAAWERMLAAIREPSNQPPFLLHGVTGSGKTEIYLRAVEETIAQGRQAIVLVPEIALTPQTVRRFVSRFPGRVGIMHSRLSTGERYDTWRRAREGKLSIIVGPRSALFAPLPDIGLIVVDESHDQSYYQSGQTPYYHARDAAVEYARLIGAVCILGTATPDITSYYRASQGKWRLLELPARILAHTETIRAHTEKLERESKYTPAGDQVEMMELPPVEVVDMRAELKSGNRSIFSRALQENLAGVLENGEQAILFLNRRGSATYVFCRDCGHVLRCPRCDNPLTYHVENGKSVLLKQSGDAGLVCHHCGYQRQMPKSCPNCKSKRIRQYGMGTQRVEAELQALFPDVRTLRWDRDTTRQKGAHEIILSHFSNQRADILIGTQMLAKGLDLPLVTLVGAVLADVGLHLPDYRAGERVFQVLSQVAGRAGRSPLGGQVIVQTFHPEHYVIQAAAGHDYAGFYQRELAYRKELGYPPFSQLVRLEYRHTDEGKAQAEAERMAGQVKGWLHDDDRRATEIIGPAPCFYARRDGQYRWQLILRGPEPASLLAGRKLGDWRVEINPQATL